MARTGSKRHTHKYFKLQEDGLWHCGDAKCTHFMPGNMPAPVWKESICWVCGRTFELNPDNMRHSNPTCDKCPLYERPLSQSDSSHMSDIDAWIEMKEREARNKRLGVKPIVVEKDEVESEYTHSSECDVFNGRECTCR